MLNIPPGPRDSRPPLRVLITCGPAFEPIDQVRRITNSSTGALGSLLAKSFTEAGHEVLCLRGVGATSPFDAAGATVRPFTTNESLRQLLARASSEQRFDVVLHAAALCDYRVSSIDSSAGALTPAAKISSRAGTIQLTLQPLPKLILELRTLFPQAWIAGWKYELEGTRDEAIARGRAQLADAATNACIVNGAAYGAGFGFLTGAGTLTALPGRQELCDFLLSETRLRGTQSLTDDENDGKGGVRKSGS